MNLFNRKKKGNFAANMVKNVVKLIAKKLAAVLGLLLMKLLPLILVGAIVATLISWVVEIITAENTPQKVYEIAGGIEDVSELVEIKGNDTDGYYLGFVDDFEAIVEDIVVYMNDRAGVHNVSNNDFVKKIIKAEIAATYPDLGGKIPENSDGFQGVVKIDRISPNKTKGEMKNTGVGEKTNVEDKKEDEPGTPEQEQIVKKWKKGDTLVFVNNAYMYEQTPSKINKDKDTGNWNKIPDVTTDGYKKIKKGDIAEYTGVYKVNKNPKTEKITIYVQIKIKSEDGKEEETCFVNSLNVNKDFEKEEKNEKNDKTGKKENKITSRAKTKEKTEESSQNSTNTGDDKTAGTDAGKIYTLSIAAGHNYGDNAGAEAGSLKEHEMTVKVAEKVEQLFSIYKNIKVVQTGTTRDNKYGVKKGDRVSRAKAAHPVLDIQIHFNSTPGATGVEVEYSTGDNVSKQLAEILAKHMSQKMGLKNRGTNGNNYTIIDSYAQTGFPSVITEGGFIDGPEASWLNTDAGITKYAQGIVDGVLEYLKVDHQGYGATTETVDNITEDIESKARKMTYVKPETMKKYIEESNEEALNVFTLDDNNNVITATWSMDGGELEISENMPMEIKNSLSKYVVPFEYLLYFYMDSNYTKFSEDLADEIMKSEIIAAIQDNVTTTSTTITTEQKKEADSGGYDWQETASEGPIISESVSTSLNIIYADVWCAKFSQSESYAEELINLDTSEKIVRVKGTVTESSLSGTTGEYVKEEGQEVIGQDEEGNDIYGNYKIYEKVRTDSKTIENQYAVNEMKVSEEGDKFVNLFNKHSMDTRLRQTLDKHLFLILEKNERTTNLVKLTKYLIYKATNISYYDEDEGMNIVEYDFSEFTKNSLNSMGLDGDYGDWDGKGSHEDFIKAVAPYAVIDMDQHHVYASVTIAQAIEESGWGTSKISKECKNFFGMKAQSGQKSNQFWTGKKKSMSAQDGVAYYRVYDSLKNSVYDHGYKLQTQDCYVKGKVEKAYTSRLGPKEQISRIQASGYMPERSYVDRVWNIIQKYGLTKYDTMTAADFTPVSAGTGDVLSVCKEVTRKLLARHVHYGPGTYGNIKKVYEKDNCVVCATYVSLILYRTGLLTEKQINKYNYHFTGDIPKMLKAAGWKQVSKSNLKPGDVINKASSTSYGGGHAVIYVGNGKVWDETSATSRTNRGKSASRYTNRSGFVVWRAPNK